MSEILTAKIQPMPKSEWSLEFIQFGFQMSWLLELLLKYLYLKLWTTVLVIVMIYVEDWGRHECRIIVRIVAVFLQNLSTQQELLQVELRKNKTGMDWFQDCCNA